jgi:hypothetical protein
MDRIASPVAIFAFINSASAILIWLPATAGSNGRLAAVRIAGGASEQDAVRARVVRARIA